MKYKGIALIQFIIVAVIVGAIVALAYLVFLPNQGIKTRDNQRKIDIERLRTNLFDYYTDLSCFPETIPDCHNFAAYDHKEYFPYYKCDPNGQNYTYIPEESTCPNSFEIFASLENTADPDIEKTNCASGCGPSCKFNYSANNTRIPREHNCPTEF